MLLCSINFFAQANDNETRKVRQKVETFLKTVSEKNWQETYKYVAAVVRGKDKTHIKKITELKEPDEEIKKEILEMLGELGKPDYGKISKIRFDETEENIANIEYNDKNLDGFKMVLIEGEWYFAMEIFVD